MKKFIFPVIIICTLLQSMFISCKRTGNDYTYVSKTPIIKASAISDTLHGTIKGTLLAGKTYYMDSAVTINAGDTLFIQSGVTINVINSYAFFHVNGTFISIGTSTAPNWITVPGLTGSNKQDNPSAAAAPSTDSAFTSARSWCGIACDTSCALLVIKWTHIEFAGHNYNISPMPGVLKSPSWPIYFSNHNGHMILEDSWLYGSVDDGVRFASGNICVMRNTFEKVSFTSGDCLNAKQATVGIMAYNLFVGTATNGTKASNKGSSTTFPECQLDMYNNTYVNGGWRQASTAHGSDIDFEQNARGRAYNNLIVNCKAGLRVVSSPIADTANLRYGYNYFYGDSIAVVNQFYPPGNITIPQPTDIPNPSYLPTGYVPGAVYSADALVGQNNPLFVNYPLPCPYGYTINYVGYNNPSPYNFRLQASSPAIGKGFTGFTPNNVVPIDPIYGATAITPPGQDIGCYQSNGTGNQH
jgi:hypothetical protein